MVFRDLSTPDIAPNACAERTPPLAGVLDRFIALMLDFLIFSPIVSLIGAGLLKEVKTLLMLSSMSSEALAVWAVFICVSFAAVVLLQSVFLFFWQGTPGQIFMQMRVVSYPHAKARLSFSQCVLRSSFWSLSFFCLCIPFLEVLGHPLRRAFYDRVSDTLVITTKVTPDSGPLPIETRFVGSWLSMLFVGLSLFGAILLIQSYHSLRKLAAQAHVQTDSKDLCNSSVLSTLFGDERVDTALALYLLGSIDSKCLAQQADSLLWQEPAGNSALAYLGKALSSEDESLQARYYTEACKVENSEVCLLSRLLSQPDEAQKNQMKVGRGSLLVAKVLYMDAQIESGELLRALELIADLRATPALAEALEKKYVRLVWELRESQGGGNHRGRAPASSEAQEIIQEFKDRYEVP